MRIRTELAVHEQAYQAFHLRQRGPVELGPPRFLLRLLLDVRMIAYRGHSSSVVDCERSGVQLEDSGRGE